MESVTPQKATTNSEDVTIPVIQEDLTVELRAVATGAVRIRKVVHEREEIVDEPLFAQTVDVERVEINQVVDGPIPIRQEGDTTVISIVEEALVITKQLILKEELRITKRTAEIRDPQIVSVRSEEVIVERFGG